MAHIRHIHTDYESLLRTTTRPLARLRIEPKCLRVLLKWRGEDDEVEFEERTEEVIVIEDSDDEDSDDELDSYDYTSKRGGPSDDLEIISWKRNGRNVEIQREDLPQAYFQPAFAQLVERRPLQRHPVSVHGQPLPHSTAYEWPMAYSARNPQLMPPPAQHTGHLGNVSNPIIIQDSPPQVPTRDPHHPAYGLPPPPPHYPSSPIAIRSVTIHIESTKPPLIDRSAPVQSTRPTTPTELPRSSMTNPVDLTIWSVPINSICL
jgi:hypothetical protein